MLRLKRFNYIIVLLIGFLLGNIFMWHYGLYSKSELLKRGIVVYNKSGTVVWVQDANLQKEEK